MLCQGSGTRTADLIAYFAVRAATLLNDRGTLGLIATNSIAQGDTAETGLRNVLNTGVGIFRARASMKWPTASASVHVSLIWATRRPFATQPVLDGEPVDHINEYLRGGSTALWTARPIKAYADFARKGSEIYGDGFLLSTDEAAAWIQEDAKYRDVLFPYFGARDLLQSLGQQASRWVINFFDWPLSRAAQYPRALARVTETVKPDRDRVAREATSDRWWQYRRRATALYDAIGQKDEVLVLGYTTNTVHPTFVSAHQVFTNGVVVMPTANWHNYGVIASSAFGVWAYERASSLKDDLRLAPSDIIATFPFAAFEESDAVVQAARALDTAVHAQMHSEDLPLTDIVMSMHDPSRARPGAEELRLCRDRLDDVVLPLLLSARPESRFVPTRFGVRYLADGADLIMNALLEWNRALVESDGLPLVAKKKSSAGTDAPTLFGVDA